MVRAPLVVIVGETASGKSALALDIAQHYNGELICADSRTVYRGMDIGTAKPTAHDRQLVPHHLLDVVTPNESFTAADFKKHANFAIDDITSRGKLPVMVGGTGLYVDSLLYDFQFARAADAKQRRELSACSVEELQDKIQRAGLKMPLNHANLRHLVRVLETGGMPQQEQIMRPDTIIVGINIERQILHDRIEERVNQMMQNGLAQEAVNLFAHYGQECQALQTIGYQEFLPYMHGQAELHEVESKIIIATRQYAKRQRTWFKRNKSIHWHSEQIQIVDLITTFLNK